MEEVLDFRNSTTWPMQEQGREQAKQALQLGEGTAFDALNIWMADEKAMESKWGDFAKYLRSFLPE